MSDDQAVETMKAWLDAKFEGGRHERRVDKIEPANS
jgi:ribose 5-phosphate isomerase RpiB